MKPIVFLRIAVTLAASIILAPPLHASDGSLYAEILKNPLGLKKLAALAAMENTGKIDPAVLQMLVSDKEPLIRGRCAEIIGRIGDPSGIPYLTRLVDDANSSVVEAAAYALGLTGDTLALEPLGRCLRGKGLPIKQLALEALGKTGRRQAAKLIIPYLRNFQSDLRARSALALAFTADSASAAECEILLQDQNPHVVACALYAWGRLGYRKGAAQIAELLGHESAEVRFRAVEALLRLKAGDAVEMIAALTRDRDRWVAIKAAEALGRIGSKKGAPALAELLASNDDYVKTVALGGLAVIGEKKQFEAIKPLLDDASPMVRRAALGALAAAGKGEARADILKALDRGTTPEKSTALEILGTLSASDDLLPLVRTLGSSSGHLLREGAAAGLGNWSKPGELGRPCGFADSTGRKLTPLEVLVEAANGTDWVVASIAIESLGKVAPIEIVRDLVRLCDTHRSRLDGDRRLAAVEAIASRASKIDAEQSAKLGLPAFFAKACTDSDPRVAAAAAGAATKFGMKIDPKPTGAWDRGTYPWGAPALPMGEKHILLSTPRGDIRIQLDGDAAPNAVKTILMLAERGFYDNLSFHRVVPGFVIQGGCPRGDGWGDAGFFLRNEVNPGRYEPGTVGLADSGKDTAGSQFFITHTAQPHLDGRYTVVGQVVSGMDVVNAIEEGDTFRVKVIDDTK